MNNLQNIEKAKGRPLLQWVGKKPLDKIEYYPAQEKEIYGKKDSKEFNKLFWGDNLQVLAHLIKEYRGKIDLIYIDPPFDSKADYVKKVKIRGEKIEGEQQNLLEEKQYTDIWMKDEYLQFMYERLLIMRELLSDKGGIYLHCDWHKSSYLRLIMDEVFGEKNFVNEIIWSYRSGGASKKESLPKKHDNILLYRKTDIFEVNNKYERQYLEKSFMGSKQDKEGRFYVDTLIRDVIEGEIKIVDKTGKIIKYNTRPVLNLSSERVDYPTQKPEGLLRLLIEIASSEGDLIADFFVGSGTTIVEAQRLGRSWVGCDINLGAVQTSTKRLNQIIENQLKEKQKLIKEKFDGLYAFKVYNVNDYDVFKNELESKSITMEMYGIEPIKRSYFDGVLDNNFVKIMPMNRVLNKLDIKNVLKNIEEKLDSFNVKKKSKTGEPTYEEGVVIICSGAEIDVFDYLKKENKTGVKVEIKDILTDKNQLIFKKKPEAKIDVKVKNKKLSVEIKEFFSPILMRKLEIENEKAVKKESKTKVEDFRQIIDSVAIDVDYDGKLFNAEIMDLPTKKEIIKSKYEWDYKHSGKETVAIKIIDVLGEEYFETFEVKI